MVAVNHILLLLDHQVMPGVDEIVNAYTFRTNGEAGLVDYEFLINIWVQHILPFIEPIQATTLFHSAVELLDLTDNLGYARVDLTGEGGERTGEALPTFVSWSFMYLRATRATRHGHKRIAGATEPDVVGNNPTSAIVPALEACANRLELGIADMTTVPVYYASPVIVRRVTGTPGYSVINEIESVQFMGIGTQNSRKAPF